MRKSHRDRTDGPPCPCDRSSPGRSGGSGPHRSAPSARSPSTGWASCRWPETAQARLQRRLDQAGIEYESAEARRLAPSIAPGHQRFGAVIATYDRPDTCAAAVASVLAQSVDDCTVIVVNDGGTIPALPAHERVTCVTLSQHTGNLGLVRNVGIRLIRQ